MPLTCPSLNPSHTCPSCWRNCSRSCGSRSVSSSRPPGFSTRATSRRTLEWRRQIGQHQRQRRRVERLIGHRQPLEIAAPQLDVAERRQPALGRRQHRGRVVDRDRRAPRTARWRPTSTRCRSRDRRPPRQDPADRAPPASAHRARRAPRACGPTARQPTRRIPATANAAPPARLAAGGGPVRPRGSARAVRAPAATAAARCPAGCPATSRTTGSCLQRATSASRCRPAPSDAG